MRFLLNVKNGKLWKICQLCSEPMCWVETQDNDGYEETWWHCHDCDLRDCDEEAYED
jgi:hypothetical protein